MYALRHSSIMRMLLKKVPTRWWRRAQHIRSMIEKYYSRYITEHSDDVTRHALLQHAMPGTDNVVALAG